MTPPRAKTRWSALSGTMLTVLMLAASHTASAQQAPDNATVRLIQLLIEKGVLTQDQAASLFKQAQDEGKRAAAPGKAAAKGQSAKAAEPAAAPPPAADPQPAAPGTVRVTYVPQIVRDQIASEVRQQVMSQAQSEGWAAPNAAPEWTKRVRVYGDIRTRAEGILEAKKNAPIPDFNGINSSTGFDTSSGNLPPSINSTENRYRPRLRARLGVQADINDWVTSDFRLATGNDSSPVSTNQTLGGTGDFAKYSLWLDRGYLALKPYQYLKAYVGRSPNPFWTTDMIFSDDLNFDGLSAMASYPINGALSVFANAGAFSLFNTELAFSTFSNPKFPSHDKYLFGGQAGVNFKPRDNFDSRLAAGFFAFTNVDGKLSNACTIVQSNIGCNTDDSRTQFVQYGNSMFPIRSINLTGTSSSTPEYYGLASRFGVLDVHGAVAYSGFRVPVTLDGEFAKNLAFDRRLIASRGPVNNLNGNSKFEGGDTGYSVRLTIGKPEIADRWDWNVYAGYRYLESDAVLDALNDSNFHLGGTNAKGYMVGASVGLARNLYLAARYYSASQISGSPYTNDVVQVDLNARF